MATNKKFETTKTYYKTDKNGNLVLDKTGKRIEISVYNGITLEEMIDWLEANGDAEDKKAFKEAYYSYADGTPMPVVTKKDTGEKYQKKNFINAKRTFFKRHNEELLPVKKEVAPKANQEDRMKNW